MNLRAGSQHTSTVANFALLLFLFLTIFIVMVMPSQVQKIIYHLCITGIFLSAFLCIDKNLRRRMRYPIVLTIVIQWAYVLTGNFILNGLSKSLTICLYITIAFFLVKQVASSKKVSRVVILESVNCYLMIGMFFSVLIALIMLLDPAAYSFQSPLKENSEMLTNFNEYLYYGINAFTTVTYGDVFPISPVAKSLSMAMGFTGQMYVAIIIAMLVGKYSGGNGEE